MNKVTTLIAYGPNNIEVPCRFFADLESGKKRCDEIFGIEGEEMRKKDTGELRGYRYKKDLEMEEDPYPISNELFTRFYYGCGGAYAFALVEIPFDTKFVGFDLD